MRVPVLALLSFVALLPAAHASTYDFNFGGADYYNNPYSISFAVDPATAIEDGSSSSYLFPSTPGSFDGKADTFSISPITAQPTAISASPTVLAPFCS